MNYKEFFNKISWKKIFLWFLVILLITTILSYIPYQGSEWPTPRDFIVHYPHILRNHITFLIADIFNSPAICELRDYPFNPDYCIAKIAIDELDFALCDEIEGIQARNEYCKIEVARLSKDKSLCEEMPTEPLNYRQMCFVRLVGAGIF